MILTNETKHMKWHESCKHKCRLDLIICNKKQRLNKHKGICDKGYFFNPSNCECQCDKSCGTGEYLDYSNCKCKKIDWSTGWKMYWNY